MKDRNRLFFKNVLCAVYKMTFFVRLYATQKIDLCSLKIRKTLAVFTVSVMQHGTYKQRPSSVVSCHWSTWVNSVADSDDSNFCPDPDPTFKIISVRILSYINCVRTLTDKKILHKHLVIIDNRRKRSHTRNGFWPWIRALGGFGWWKNSSVENLVQQYL
jgi:hypothetical protein